MTINNPTEFRFNHNRLRANNVIIIPTPTNNSNLNSIMESNNDFNQYYNFGNYTDVRYYKTVTPKTSISGMNVNCYKKNDTPQSATVYKANGTYHAETTGYTGQTVSFNHQDVIFNSENIPDEEIFFKDSENAPIALTVFDDTNSVTLTNHATKDSFEFKVPSCVHKVEIEHNTSHEAPAGSNKAKIHIDLDDSSKDYYINEKNNNTDNTFSIVSSKPIPCKRLITTFMQNDGVSVYIEKHGSIDAAIGFPVHLLDSNGCDEIPICKLYWHYDVTIGNKTYYLYTCLTMDDNSNLSIALCYTPNHLGDTYTPFMPMSDDSLKDKNLKVVPGNDETGFSIDGQKLEGVNLTIGANVKVSETTKTKTLESGKTSIKSYTNYSLVVSYFNTYLPGVYTILNQLLKVLNAVMNANDFPEELSNAKIPVVNEASNYIFLSDVVPTVGDGYVDANVEINSLTPTGTKTEFNSLSYVTVPVTSNGATENHADYPNANLDFGALCDSILSTN